MTSGPHRQASRRRARQPVARLAAWGLVLWVGLVPAGAAVAGAQEPLVANDFSIDYVQGPVLGSSRSVGLAGANVALAEGIDAAPWNPASYASRSVSELSWFEWEPTFGLLLPNAFSSNDFFNSGREEGFEFDDFFFWNLGLRFQFGPVGFGILGRFQTYSLDAPDGSRLEATFTLWNLGLARMFWDGRVVIGAGVRASSLSLGQGGLDTGLVQFFGAAPEVGVLLRPDRWPLRVGFSARMGVSSSRSLSDGVVVVDGVRTAAGFVLPRSVNLPWEFELGAAWQLGNKPLNPRWVDPQRREAQVRNQLRLERWRQLQAQVRRGVEQPPDGAGGRRTRLRTPADPYRWLSAVPVPMDEEAEQYRAEERAHLEQIEALEELARLRLEQQEREYLLLTTELILVGPTSAGVGVEGFLAQERRKSGSNPTLGLRLGIEGEPWPRRLKLRAGTYLEPSRFEGPGFRMHGTGGFDFRVVRWDVFGLIRPFDIKLTATIDVAPRYFDWGFGIGVWH